MKRDVRDVGARPCSIGLRELKNDSAGPVFVCSSVDRSIRGEHEVPRIVPIVTAIKGCEHRIGPHPLSGGRDLDDGSVAIFGGDIERSAAGTYNRDGHTAVCSAGKAVQRLFCPVAGPGRLEPEYAAASRLSAGIRYAGCDSVERLAVPGERRDHVEKITVRTVREGVENAIPP